MATYTSLTDLVIQYNPKFELYFSDQNNRPVLLQILKKNYDGDVFNLVGTDNPVEIIWDSDDDVYSPIKGSRCKLNFFITDYSVFDDFYKSDEREYKVNIYYYNSSGDAYEELDFKPETTQVNYDADFGAALFWESYWSGFIVVDRWQEALTTSPYPVSLEAIDGLGTLSGFDAPTPFKNEFFETTDDYTNPVKSLFYYITEILKKTGHKFDIYVANDIRKFDGDTDTIADKFDFEEQSTIFHDITVNDIPIYDTNLNPRNSKEVLEYILKLTNSRIFQSYGHWYIISNSNLIDNRIDQQTVCPSGAETFIDLNASLNFGEEEIIIPDLEAPDIRIQGSTSKADGVWYFYVTNIGGDITSATWTLPDGSTQSDSKSIPKITFPVESGHDGQTISISCSNAIGSDSDTQTLTIETYTASPTATGGTFTIQVVENNLKQVVVSPKKHQFIYTAREVGESFSCEFILRATQFPIQTFFSDTVSINAVTRFTTGLFSNELYTTTKVLDSSGDYQFNPIIKVTVSGSIPNFPQTNYLHLSGQAGIKQFTTTVNITNNTSNTTINKTQFVFTGTPNTEFAENLKLTATNDREFTNSGNVTGLIVGNYIPPDNLNVSDSFFGQSLLLQNLIPDYVYDTYEIGVIGKIGNQDQTVSFVLTGGPEGIGGVTSSASFNPTGTFNVDANAGSLKIKVTHVGKVIISTNNNNIAINELSPTSFGGYRNFRTLTFSSQSSAVNSFFISWLANNDQPSGRYASVFVKDEDGNTLDTISIVQPYLATDSYNSDYNYFN